jgi:hypothetical protein
LLVWESRSRRVDIAFTRHTGMLFHWSGYIRESIAFIDLRCSSFYSYYSSSSASYSVSIL